MENLDIEFKATLIKFPLLNADNFLYKISESGIIKFPGLCVDYTLPGNRVVLCYNWAEEELIQREDVLRKGVMGYTGKMPRDQLTITIFKDFDYGSILSAEIAKPIILPWKDFNVDNGTERQRLEFKILEKVKRHKLNQTKGYENDRIIKDLMKEYIDKFGNQNSWVV
ncbi:MAG: hypothetical protein PHH54_00335 [Candidatus Nanoarchaeia archaeon]|nr:hypothetical protein [Candidatus Nanoarchaeia archaeon]MDD5740410.1 hypothetical protein [Candidatus Nanoarchaeia archaeon]